VIELASDGQESMGIRRCVSREEVARHVGVKIKRLCQDQERVPGLVGYLSDGGILGRQVPFCLDLGGPVPLRLPVRFGNQPVQASVGY